MISVDEYLDKKQEWIAEIKQIRELLLECGLTETIKWNSPCYMYNDKNILLIGSFKNYCSVSFIKGTLLKDNENILVAPGENSQSVKLIKITDVEQIIEKRAILKQYVFEAIEIEKAGLKVEKESDLSPNTLEELQKIFNQNKAFKKAFHELTPGRQRGYHLFFSAPKQSKTKLSRIKKYMNRIMKGYGLHDCTCGHSKRLPNCDGSHKNFSPLQVTD